MLRAINSFRGEAPRVTPRALPDNGAQGALNAKLLTGDLCAWRQFATTMGLSNPGPVQTIYLLNDTWLSWDVQVDVARGTVAGDTTFRTYLTAPGYYAEPRFTNYSLATSSGGPPFPSVTRPLGVPPPDSAPTAVPGVGTTPTISVTDAGNELATSWTASGDVIVGTTISTVSQDAALGNPLPSYQFNAKDSYPTNNAYMYRDFGVDTSATIQFDCDFYATSSFGNTQAEWRIGCTAAGSGCKVQVGYPSGFSTLYLQIGSSNAWADSNFFIEQVPMTALTSLTWYHARITMTQNQSGSSTVNVKIYDSTVTTLIAEAEVTAVFVLGGYCGMSLTTTATDREFVTHYDNIQVQASGSTTTPTNTATSYVYTFVNDFDQESAPSPASSTILRPDGITVTVTTPTTLPSAASAEYGITTKRIYRAATGNAGTAFLFVAEIPLAQADYDDTLTDAELGEELPSELWALPPDDLEGILALPNGVMAGFSKNQLCLSAQNFPHAWPVQYRLNTDTDIVGIGNIDTTVVIGTESFVYVASGNDPANYSMAKFEVPYACVSKTSFAYLTGIGVVFAGPDGLMAVVGPGQVRNLTETVFTRDQWQALNPSSIKAVAHNDIYWMHWESGSSRGCYALDMKQTGFGVIQMAFHASAAYVDPIEDKMYLVLNEDTEPDDASLPVPAEPPHYVDARTIYEFEGHPTALMNYRWRSKLWMLEHPAWFSIAQVRAQDYANLVMRVYGDGVQIDEVVIADETEFTLAATDEYRTLEIEFIGTSTVRLGQAAEDVSELG